MEKVTEIKKELCGTCFICSYLLFQHSFLLEDAIHFCRSLWPLQFLTIQHFLLQFFNRLNSRGVGKKKEENESYDKVFISFATSSGWKKDDVTEVFFIFSEVYLSKHI